MAAGVAYYAFFSLFPLLLGLLSIVGIILASPEIQDRLLNYWTDSLPGSKGFVTENVVELVELRGALGIGALVGLLWLPAVCLRPSTGR
jgi:membrane protein